MQRIKATDLEYNLTFVGWNRESNEFDNELQLVYEMDGLDGVLAMLDREISE